MEEKYKFLVVRNDKVVVQVLPTKEDAKEWIHRQCRISLFWEQDFEIIAINTIFLQND